MEGQIRQPPIVVNADACQTMEADRLSRLYMARSLASQPFSHATDQVRSLCDLCTDSACMHELSILKDSSATGVARGTGG